LEELRRRTGRKCASATDRQQVTAKRHNIPSEKGGKESEAAECEKGEKGEKGEKSEKRKVRDVTDVDIDTYRDRIQNRDREAGSLSKYPISQTSQSISPQPS
jgi:hypothetical protein